MKWFATYILFILIVAPGCDLRKREENLKKKEAELAQKEQQLLLKEKTLQLKEEELQKAPKTDSGSIVDTMKLYNPAVIGFWSVARLLAIQKLSSGIFPMSQIQLLQKRCQLINWYGHTQVGRTLK
jgi:hypothetical protein